jgi:hypothetical protein
MSRTLLVHNLSAPYIRGTRIKGTLCSFDTYPPVRSQGVNNVKENLWLHEGSAKHNSS